MKYTKAAFDRSLASIRRHVDEVTIPNSIGSCSYTQGYEFSPCCSIGHYRKADGSPTDGEYAFRRAFVHVFSEDPTGYSNPKFDKSEMSAEMANDKSKANARTTYYEAAWILLGYRADHPNKKAKELARKARNRFEGFYDEYE